MIRSAVIHAIVAWVIRFLVSIGVPARMPSSVTHPSAYASTQSPPSYPLDVGNPWKPDVAVGNTVSI